MYSNMTTTTHVYNVSTGWQPKVEEGDIARGSLLDHLGDVADVLDRGPIGLLTDMDGTISEIVPQPDGATVSPRVRSALGLLRSRLPLVAIITGRSSRQAREIAGIQDLLYIGNHGLERLEGGSLSILEEARPFAPFLEQLRESLRSRLTLSGLLFEDKGGSFAIHYRMAEDPDIGREKVLSAIRELAEGRVRIILGKTVINVLPPVDLNKGTAVISLVREYGLSGAILLGDDVTDIDSFQAASRLADGASFASISAAVVGSDCPEELVREADYTLPTVSAVEDFLDWMVDQTDPP